ncbi:hypothetical protein LTS15_007278 [Exophiala xenobiotica]|nr:hypothetical protein LTS15_007278 [Exophiala xenobiotica]
MAGTNANEATLFVCPVGILTNDSQTAGLPTWRYFYNASFPNINLTGLPDAGVSHSSEIKLVYGTYSRMGATEEEKALSHYMQTAWANFAKHPQVGPGWAQVPALAQLGSNGMLKTMATAAELDSRCVFYLDA